MYYPLLITAILTALIVISAILCTLANPFKVIRLALICFFTAMIIINR